MIGIVTVADLRRARRYVIVGAFVITASPEGRAGCFIGQDVILARMRS